MRGPLAGPNRSRLAQPSVIVLTMDLFPTALEAAGAAPPAGSTASASSHAHGQAQPDPGRATLFFVRREGGPAYGGKTIEALLRGDWKLIQDSPFGRAELTICATTRARRPT